VTYHRRPVERLTPVAVARPSILAHVARVRAPARAALTYASITAAITVGDVLAWLITHG
jgi:hypothetical protein